MVRYYQRLVINPFLALTVAIGGIVGALQLGIDSIHGQGHPVWVAGLVFGYLLLQYHCLDCGETGRFRLWRRHVCFRVVERWQTPYSAASHLFPTPATQLVLWLFVLFAGWLLLASMSGR